MDPLEHSAATGFTPFTLPLGGGKQCSGIACVPASNQEKSQHALPLIIGIHGGTCTAAYYDLCPEASAAPVSVATGIPFVSIDRPSYGQTSSILPLGQDQDFWHETARALHNDILPAVWQHFNSSGNLASIVLDANSFGVPPAIITAALHAEDPAAKYPLAGMILTGWNVEMNNSAAMDFDETTKRALPTPKVKELMMLSEPEYACYTPTVAQQLRQQGDRQNVSVPQAEVGSMPSWFRNGTEYMEKVKIPTMAAIGDRDWLVRGSSECMEAFKRHFVSTPRFDISVVNNAPHALEWSKYSLGFYLRCFGFASEIVS
ncbi:hypothetical protein LTR85_010941 [Meristemomyces frigidus]|nr:hypothetical protein LTR85_010941 [Meristemomyces frigidus]